ncbi:MAG: hypothetical protein MJA83_12755 [Gammaproteobacteria bacterium]|nr:hypothetical protein [Gammaproteobacteria bacterium]
MASQVLIACIGVSERQLSVVNSMFELLPHLRDRYKVVTMEKDFKKASIALVNADNILALRLFDKVTKTNGSIVPIMLSNERELDPDAAKHKPDLVLRSRPIKVRELLEAFTKAFHTLGHGSAA